MSSATSTETSGFRPWHFFAIVALGAATVGVMLSQRTTPEYLVMVSLTVFAAGGAAIAAYHLILPLLSQEHLLRRRPVGERTRAALESEKTLLLRTIKELEFDRAMGKVSDEDFAEMSQRLRARAVRVLQQLDQAGSRDRERIERELDERLGTAGDAAADAPARAVCAACGTANDRDARFCKQCGGRLQ
ncbi:MAG TPA: zinc ribbon domain-containing protein [Vicinamibacterales bacterium]